MFYRKTDDFDSFRCLAGACPLSCCAAWQIVIDEDSLARYDSIPGEVGRLLREGIDREEACFRQDADRRCAMLLDDGLCRLQKQCGEQALCRTCTQYPRHCEEYDGGREWTLALSCPEAARMLLTRQEPMRWITSEDDTPEPDPDDEFDDLLYDRLLTARDGFIGVLQDRTLPIGERAERVLAMAAALQELYDDGDIFGMDELFDAPPEAGDTLAESIRAFSKLKDLEVLYPDWPAMLDAVIARSAGESFAHTLRDRLDRHAVQCERLLVYFIDVCLCGAVYDGELYARTALAVYGTRWIVMLTCAGVLPLEEAAQRYAREVFHSDINPDELIAFLSGAGEI